MTTDTIFALSSGAPPAAIAVIRISGRQAAEAAAALAGTLPEPRRASLRTLKQPGSDALLDRALLLFFPGPNSATGEDLIELHLHGGRAVVRAVLTALSQQDGLREAEPGEFTRRAFAHGRIDLAEAEGLADLLQAETEAQRRVALAMAGGALSRRVEGWQRQVLEIAAKVEAELDYSDEDDVSSHSNQSSEALDALICDLEAALSRPSAERLHDGIRVVIAGPPNSGKSSLINYLSQREVAITSSSPGTTRDLIEVPVALRGTAFLLTDTAGLRDTEEEIERIGIERARHVADAADIVLWLGLPSDVRPSERLIVVQTKADLNAEAKTGVDILVSSTTGIGIERLVDLLIRKSATLLPSPDETAINKRQRSHLVTCLEELRSAGSTRDLLLVAEHLRCARSALDRITGRAGVEDMLDQLFGRFCIGK